MSSAITGALSQAQRAVEATARSLGETESGRSLTESDNAKREWVMGRRPEETDRALRASLTSSLSVEVVPGTALRFPVEGGSREVVTGGNVSGTAESRLAPL